MKTMQKVLVVDDDPVVAKSFQRTLEQKYVVVTASSGEEALGKLKEGEYDVVFTDIKMPGMSGLELTKEIKSKKSWTPVVIITGFGTQQNQQVAEELGVVDFIQKPLSPESIETATIKAIEQPKLEAPAWGILEEETKVVDPSQVMKNLAMLCSAPFIGLLYALMLPFVALGALMWMGIKTIAKNAHTKAVGMMLAAPFIGLAYIIAIPFMGLGSLLWTGGKALVSSK